MSKTVDNRIVKMQMDNAQFQSAAQSTMQTLSALSQKLKLAEATEGLKNISAKVKEVDMTKLSDGVSSVASRFSALEVMGITALTRITDAAMTAGKKFISAFTIDPITDGFKEYETKMNAIQTIMTNTSSKGTTLDDVNAALAELNEYADKTIYNFAQMTDNIGKATAAGVGLEDSVTFVKGLANVAAGFGVDATSMAGATEQMTQALASGTIRLQDWMSMERRGMGGEMLQKALIETAREMGVYVDESESFRYTLEQNWLSSDIFIKTMEKMANDPSLTAAATNVKTFSQLVDVAKEAVGTGWATSWEAILGDKEESTQLFTSIYNGFEKVVSGMAEYRNENLKTWKAEGGRAAVLNGLSNIVKTLTNLFGPFYKAFKKVIDPWNSDRLIAISKGFESWTEKIKINDKTAKNLQKGWEGFFSIFKTIGAIFKPLLSLFGGLTAGGANLIDVVASVVGNLGEWISKISSLITNSKTLAKINELSAKAGEKLAEGFKAVSEAGSDIVGKCTPYIEEFGRKTVDAFSQATSKFPEFAASAKTHVSGAVSTLKDKFSEAANAIKSFNDTYQPLTKTAEFISTAFDKAKQGVSAFCDFCKDAFNGIKNTFSKFTDWCGANEVLPTDFLNLGLLTTLFVMVKKLIPKIKEMFSSFGDIKSSIVGSLNALKDTLETYQKDLKADILKKISVSVILLAGAVALLSFIEPSRLLPSVAALGSLLAGLMAALKYSENLKPKEFANVMSSITAMIGISIAMSILAGALSKIAEFNWVQLLQSTITMLAMFVIFGKSVKSLQKVKLDPDLGMSVVLIASSLYVLAGAMSILAKLDIEGIAKSCGTMVVFFGSLSVMFKQLKKVGNMKEVGASMILVATSLTLLGAAMAIIGNLEIATIAKALGSIAAFMTALGVLFTQLKKVTNMKDVGVSMMAVAFSLKMLASAMLVLGNLKIDTLVQSLVTMGIILATFAGFISMIEASPNTDMVKIGAGMILLAAALNVLIVPLVVLGKLDFWTLVQGLAGIAVALGSLAVASQFIQPTQAAGLIAVAAALVIMAKAIQMVGELSAGQAVIALVTIAGALAILGAASLLLAPVVPTMLLLGAAIAAIGAGCLLAGSGITLVAGGLLALSGVGMTAIGILVAGILSLAATIPVVASALALGFVSFITVIGSNAPALGRALKAIFVELLNVINACLPGLMTAIGTIVQGILQILVDALPLIMDALTAILVGILDMIIEATPKLIDAIVVLFTEVVNGILEAFVSLTEIIITKLLELIAAVVNGIANGIGPVVEAITNLIINLCAAIGENTPKVVNAMFDMVIAMCNGLADTINQKAPEMKEAVKNLLNAIWNAITDSMSDAKQAGANIIDGIKQGITSGLQSIKDAAVSAAKAALDAAKDFLGINSPSREFMKVGKWSDEGMVKGLEAGAKGIEKASEKNAEGALDSMVKVMAGASDILEKTGTSSPTITPVMDLSEIQNGAKTIGDLFGDGYAIGASLSGARIQASNVSPVVGNNSGLTSSLAGSTTNNNQTIQNTFNITGTNAKEIANEVSNIIQRQVERRKAIWE